MALTCAAGTAVITHYELWHRATANRSTRTRYMLKFLFARTEESLPEQRSKWLPTGRHAALYRTLWRWYGGQAPALRPHRSVEALQAALQDPDERVRIDAYYDLGALGAEGVPALMAALKDESARCWQANIERGDFTNPSQLESPYGLAAAGAVAVPSLIEALQDRDWWLRAGAASALGCMGAEAQDAAPALAAALQDDSEWVCRNAADSLGNMGRVPAAVPALTQALDDSRAMTPWSLSDAPLRENAAMTLAKWRTPDAAVVALQRGASAGQRIRAVLGRMGVGPPLLGGEGHASRTILTQRRRDAAVHCPGLRSGAGGFPGRFSRRSVPPDRRCLGGRGQSLATISRRAFPPSPRSLRTLRCAVP